MSVENRSGRRIRRGLTALSTAAILATFGCNTESPDRPSDPIPGIAAATTTLYEPQNSPAVEAQIAAFYPELTGKRPKPYEIDGNSRLLNFGKEIINPEAVSEVFAFFQNLAGQTLDLDRLPGKPRVHLALADADERVVFVAPEGAPPSSKTDRSQPASHTDSKVGPDGKRKIISYFSEDDYIWADLPVQLCNSALRVVIDPRSLRGLTEKEENARQAEAQQAVCKALGFAVYMGQIFGYDTLVEASNSIPRGQASPAQQHIVSEPTFLKAKKLTNLNAAVR